MAGKSRYKVIAVPVDGSGYSERAIPHAVDIARANNSEIVLLHVFRPPAYEYTDIIALAGQEDQIDEVRQQVKSYLISLRNKLREEGLNARVQLIEGVGVAALICDYINEQGIDLVVMSTRGRTGLARFVFGSVANKVIHGVKAPVMLVDPESQPESDTEGASDDEEEL